MICARDCEITTVLQSRQSHRAPSHAETNRSFECFSDGDGGLNEKKMSEAPTPRRVVS